MNKTTKTIIKIGVTIAAVVGAMYAVNKYFEKAVESIDKLKIKENSHYKWRLGNVYYEKVGEGSPVLLIHDYTPYASSYEWKKLVRELSKNHTVYTMDLLGCGRSDKPEIAYTNFMYVQLVADFVNDVIGEKTDLITSGHASSIALMSANYTCEYINQLFLINPESLVAVKDMSSTLAKVTKVVLELPVIGTFAYNMITLRRNVKAILAEKYFYDADEVDDDIVDTYYKAAHCSKAKGKYVLSSIAANYMDANVPHALKNIDNNIIIIGGKYEENIDEIIEEYRGAKAEIESVIISGTKKLPHYEVAKDVAEQIEKYMM